MPYRYTQLEVLNLIDCCKQTADRIDATKLIHVSVVRFATLDDLLRMAPCGDPEFCNTYMNVADAYHLDTCMLFYVNYDRYPDNYLTVELLRGCGGTVYTCVSLFERHNLLCYFDHRGGIIAPSNDFMGWKNAIPDYLLDNLWQIATVCAPAALNSKRGTYRVACSKCPQQLTCLANPAPLYV